MSIAHCSSADSLVIFFFNRAYGEIFTLTFFGNFLENFFILGRSCASPQNKGYINCCKNFFYRCSSFFRTCILIIGIDAFQLQNNCLCAVFINTFFCPCSRISENVFKWLKCCRRPFRRFHIPYFHSNNGSVGYFAFKLVKRIACFSTDSEGFITFPYGDFLDSAGIGFFCNFKSHFDLLIKCWLLLVAGSLFYHNGIMVVLTKMVINFQITIVTITKT